MKTLIYSLIFSLCLTSQVKATPPVYYNNKVQQIIIPQKVVEFDARYFQGVDSYFSVGEQLRAEKNQEKNAEIEFYKGQVEMLLKVLSNQSGGKVIPTNPTPTNPEPNPVPSPDPTNPYPQPVPTQNPDEYKVTDIDRKVYNIFKTKCSRCHGDTKQDGGLTLVKSDTLQLLDINDRVELYDRVQGINLEARGKARMPKGGAALSDDEVETMRLWMIEESDRNRSK